MNAALIFLAVLLGLVVGSFLNVLIRRGARGESIRGRSRCESCRAKLGPAELIPLISFLLQKGRCRRCGAVLSRQYPLVELGTAVSYGLAAWLFLNGGLASASPALLIFYFIGIAAVIVILVSDLKFQLIPNGAVLTLLILGVAAGIQKGYGDLARDWAGALALSGFLAALWFLSRGRWIGFGDVKLTLPLALILGFPTSLAAFLFSFWTGGLAGIILLSIRKKTLKDRIPFGPFLLLGALLAYYAAPPFFTLTGLDALFVS